MRCSERVLDNFEEVTNFEGHLCGKGWIDVSASGCIQKRLMKIYVDCRIDLSESPNLNILKKLYNLEFREDEVFVSDCELDDVSITPLLNALEIQKTFGILNLSHNSLGKGTMEKLQKVFASCQKFGCFVLDLHQNILGPDSLYQPNGEFHPTHEKEREREKVGGKVRFIFPMPLYIQSQAAGGEFWRLLAEC